MTEKVGGKKVVVTRETEKKTIYTNASGINDDGGKIYNVRIIVPAAVSYHDTGSSEALSHFSPVELIPTTRPLDSMHAQNSPGASPWSPIEVRSLR
jgi:hypothetical protein